MSADKGDDVPGQAPRPQPQDGGSASPPVSSSDTNDIKVPIGPLNRLVKGADEVQPRGKPRGN